MDFQNRSYFVREALTEVSSNRNHDLRDRASKVLELLERVTRDYDSENHVSVNFPRVRAFSVTTDGSILLEWSFHGFRIGFSIEVDPNESSWYLVGKGHKVMRSGYLKPLSIKQDVFDLLSFVFGAYGHEIDSNNHQEP